MYVAILIDYDRFNVGVDGWRIRRKHIPPLKQAGPQDVRPNQSSDPYDGGRVNGQRRTEDDDQMKDDEGVNCDANNGLASRRSSSVLHIPLDVVPLHSSSART
jgi:hypothetical protein